ncbi:hypothetical protein Avbf_09031 [Armadillidium vulgare]|nr:hypothetical protein Avbf_09031 [Armadillidium vulgare]
MDVKYEEEFKERNCYESIDMKSEMEIKEEPFDVEEEVDKLLDKICTLDQNQSFADGDSDADC